MARAHIDFELVEYDERVKRIAEELGDLFNEAPDVLKKSIAAASRNVRKETVKQANKIYDYNKYGKPLPATNKTMKVKVGSKLDRWYASLTSTGPMSELADFMVTPNVTRGRRPDAYSARVKKGSPMTKFDASPNRKPFLVYVKAGESGKRHKVFVERKGDDRKPIKKLLGPSVPAMLENAGFQEIAANNLQSEIDRQIANYVRRTLKKAGK